MRRTLAPLFMALAMTSAACDLIGVPEPPLHACTEIGCESAVAFNLDADLVNGVEYRLDACVEDDCATETIEVPEGQGVVGQRVGRFDLGTDADRVLFLLPEADYSGPHEVSLRVTAADGSVAVELIATTEFDRQQPNGPDCPPVCWFAEINA